MKKVSWVICCVLLLGGCGLVGGNGTGGDQEPEAMAGITAAHNEVRQGLSTSEPLSALKWSSALAASAQAWADKCQWGHSGQKGIGENLFGGTGSYDTKQVVRAWAEEVQDYNYDDNSCNPGKVCGHYTQVVWRDTTEVGCAMAKCDGLLGGTRTAEYWVCQYNPPGNFVGKKPY